MTAPRAISIFNQVLGPVMRGPSSSHTAGAYHIARMACSLLGERPRRAQFAFDPDGSYAATYAPQGADRGFAMGLLGKPLTDEAFFTALTDAPQSGLDIRFDIRRLDHSDHPNTVDLQLVGQHGLPLHVVARSIGGGEVEITRVNDWPVLFNGSAYETLLQTAPSTVSAAAELLRADGALLEEPQVLTQGDRSAVTARRGIALGPTTRQALAELSCETRVWESAPVYFIAAGQPLFASGAEMVQLAQQRRISLGQLALEYEACLLGMSQAEVLAEMLRRYAVMEQAVTRGLDREFTGLQLMSASAGAVFEAEAAGRLSVRGVHTRAAARALAVMHVDGAMGVVCAAPTGGSAGVLPGALVTLAEQRRLNRDQIALALLAAGAVGVIVARRGTFAAEVAGCQVEIGASGAMAAAAVVDAVNGTAQQACDAAAIAFQNTMGSVCDLLHGIVEVPCHTRNAVAAANAFVCADLILGGYPNLVPLDETIDAVCAVGRMMPAQLRCTSQGGLAVTPSAQALKPRCHQQGCTSHP